MIARLSKLRRDQRGVATVEFALWTTMFFMIALIALDFGAYFVQRAKIDEALSTVAVDSFAKKDNVNFSAMQASVRALAADQAVTVSTSCNGAGSCTNLNRTCACLRSNGSYVATTCGTGCTGSGMTTGSTAGYYLQITATRQFRAMVIPNSVLDRSNLRGSATVRLQ